MILDLRNEDLNKLLQKAEEILSIDSISALAQILKEKGLKLGIAESLTGGMLSSKIVDVPGTSSVLAESIVSYSADCKIKRLGIDKKDIDKYTVVSERVAQQMVNGILQDDYVSIALSTTGNAGPTTDNNDFPVGLTYIGVGNKNKTEVKGFIFPGTRNQVRLLACMAAIESLKEFLE